MVGTRNIGAFIKAIGEIKPKFAEVDLADSGDLVPAVTGKKIKLVTYLLIPAADVTMKFQTGASTDLSGAMSTAAKFGVGAGVPFPSWLLETKNGEKLNLVLGAAVAVKGHISYFLDSEA